MIDPVDFLTSEIRELEQMLDSTPTTEVIHRMTLRNRLQSVGEALARELAIPRQPRAKLTFRAQPAAGRYGVAEGFDDKASDASVEAISAVVAGFNQSLQFMGPIPEHQKNQLLLTGSAIGTFGFEIEPPSGT